MSNARSGSTRRPPTRTICRVKRPICPWRATARCWSSSDRCVTDRYSARCSRCVSRISRRSFWISSPSMRSLSVAHCRGRGMRVVCDLVTSEARRAGLPTADRRRSYGAPEGVEGGFGLAHQHVRSVTQLLAALHQASCGLAYLLRPPPDFRWKHRAVVDMRAEAVAQIREAYRTQMGATASGIRDELEQGEAATARRALGDRVIPAIKEEESTLFGAQRPGPPAIQVG